MGNAHKIITIKFIAINYVFVILNHIKPLSIDKN